MAEETKIQIFINKKELYMPTSEEEFQADLDAQDMRYFQYCREQEEMYNDPVMNWSGLR